MPKNQAITAVLQGDIGFDPAVVGRRREWRHRALGRRQCRRRRGRPLRRMPPACPPPTSGANFEINGGIVHSDLIGVARTNIRARPIGTPTLTFQQDVSLFAGSLAAMSVGDRPDDRRARQRHRLGGGLRHLQSGAINLTGGTARDLQTLDGGTIHIRGTATVDASAPRPGRPRRRRPAPARAGPPGPSRPAAARSSSTARSPSSPPARAASAPRAAEQRRRGHRRDRHPGDARRAARSTPMAASS